MASQVQLSRQDIKTLAISTIVVGIGFTAYSQITEIQPALEWTAIAAIVLLTREAGQRIIAEMMDAYVEVELSNEGSGLAVAGAALAFLTQLPILLLFPLTTSFSGKTYEHWGRSVDAIWMKRQFWMIYAGIIAMLIAGFLSLALGLPRLAEAFMLFTFLQLMPFDYKSIPTGRLDGAYILRWSGAYWLTVMGLTLIGLALTL